MFPERCQCPVCRVDVDGSEFQKQLMQILEGITKGEQDIQDGRTFTHAEAQDKLNKWFD